MRWFALTLLFTFVSGQAAIVRADDAAALAFFEQKIRPVLVKECYSCHSSESKKLKGGLRLDSRAAVLKGGDTGPALIAGKPDESLLIAALKYDGVEMPPRGKLSDAVIADFTRWVQTGAVDPRLESAKAVRNGIDISAGKQFWSYAPLKRDEMLASIDDAINRALAEKKLKPVARTRPEVLVRRLYFDLIGLPPTPAEIDAFVQDRSPRAYENLVDRLLASPRFGERWGRHWLDVVRFAESLTLRGFIFKESWRYRDYVIASFNADAPFDQFIRQQIAGDLLPSKTLEESRKNRIATTFLTLGNSNLEDQDKNQLVMDVVDEQIDVIGKAFLGQTISCARCHDHKFDPIPTRDYYAIAGILKNARLLEHANVSKWIEVPLPMTAEAESALRAYDTQVASLETEIKAEKTRLKGSGAVASSGVVAPKELPGLVIDDVRAKRVGEWTLSKHSGSYIGEGYLHDGNASKGEKSLTFEPEIPNAGTYEILLAYTPGSNRSTRVPVTVLSADGEKIVTINERETPPIDGRFISLGQYRFEKSGQGYVLVANEGTDGHVIADAVVFLSSEAAARKSKSKQADPVAKLEAKLKTLKASAPPREMVMSVVEEPKISDTRVHIRGSVHTLGETVPRGFLQVAIVGKAPAPPQNQSGRRELADWIASSSNPLTARVYVNRVWHWLFGEGLVRTVDNFGTTGEKPSHPELLDRLALDFMADGWSTKRLIRRIVLSKAYRRDSNVESDSPDPENRLLAHANRRRLDAESLRDAILAVSDKLQFGTRGRTYPESLAADYGYRSEQAYRSVYLPVFRNAMPDMFEVFDFADPSMVVGKRDVSTVASQALFLLNHPFVIAAAHDAAKRVDGEKLSDDSARIDRAYRLTLGREPTAPERAIAAKIVANPDGLPLLFQALFASIDFRYVD